MSSNTRKQVTAEAERLAKNLRAKHFGLPLRIKVGEAQDTDTGGSRIRVASLGAVYAPIEIWYDKYFHDNYGGYDNGHNYWVGFITEQRPQVEILIRALNATNNADDYDETEEIDIKIGDFNALYLLSDFGMSWLGGYTLPSMPFHIDRFSCFIEHIIRSLPEFSGRTFVEGACGQITNNHYERDPEARRECIERFTPRYHCQVCNMSFLRSYGEIGRDFIHVHHVEKLSEAGEHEINPEKHLVPVCPNCHAMLHRGDKLLTVEELRELWQKNHPQK